MSNPFQLGPWLVEPSLNRLSRDGEQRCVSHKAMAVLLLLARRPGRVVAKEELIAQVWEERFTSDEVLTTVVYELRKALGDDARRPAYVETIRKGGYRLIAAVASSADEAAPKAPQATPRRWLQAAAPAVAAALAASALTAVLFLHPWRGEAPAEAAAAPAVAEEIGSLAVLPLASFGEECREDDFADALTEMLTVELAELTPIEVLPSLAVRPGDGPWDLERASALPADAVVEGSMIRTGDRLWISAQLVDTRSGELLWGGSYERPVEDLLVVQRELAWDIAHQLRAGSNAESDAPRRR